MIKLENMHVDNLVRAVYSARNAMDSWSKSDSDLETMTLGKADLALAEKLVKAGSDHSKFMRMINVTVDITAPRFWWIEYDTYKVGTVRNSCSTMHTIMNCEITVDDFSFETTRVFDADDIVSDVLELLNNIRDVYVNYEEYSGDGLLAPKVTKEKVWRSLIELLPQSYNQRATVQLNYAVLRNMYHARKNHKLDEWREFCKWVESLPYSELITEV